MIGFARLVIVTLVLLGLTYLLASRFLQDRRRARLEADWTPDRGNRELFVNEELAAYTKAMRPRLAFAVIVLPMVYFAVVLYLTNSA